MTSLLSSSNSTLTSTFTYSADVKHSLASVDILRERLGLASPQTFQEGLERLIEGKVEVKAKVERDGRRRTGDGGMRTNDEGRRTRDQEPRTED
jgi:hypothetical protein